jgi:hypothetical protein
VSGAEEKGVLERSLLVEALKSLAALDSKVAVVQGQNNIIIAEQQRAAEGRKETHERLRALEQSSAETAATTRRIAPMVEAHEQTYQRGVGAAWLWRILWGLVCSTGGALAALFGIKISGH